MQMLKRAVLGKGLFHVPYFSGLVRDAMGAYDVVHYTNATAMILGSVLLMLYPVMKKWEEKKCKRNTRHCLS